MGLISASSLGQPIIRVKISSPKVVISPNRPQLATVNPNVSTETRGRPPQVVAALPPADMAPALTTESSAEHRKRSLSNDLSNCVINKLDPAVESVVAAAAATTDKVEQQPTDTTSTEEEPPVSQEDPGPSSNPTVDQDTPQQPSQTNSDEEAALKAAADEVLGHNVDEILQVLESMESDGKCGGVVGTSGDAAEDSMLRLLGSELELLAGADICSSQETEPASPTPKVQVEERVTEARDRQYVLERRCERLMRRVRKMQARGTARHAAHQLQDLVTSARALLKARNASHRSHAASQQQATKEQLLDSENVKNMSAAALVNLVRKISNANNMPASQGLAQALSPDQATSLRDGAGSLSFRLRHAESGFDSDVTASSSGGESCDETAGYNPNHTGTLPICKRAAWRYSRERASVVSRWTWLQANISDLEYRIRQYSECHKHLRLNKGPVRLEEPPCKSLQAEESMVMNGCHSETAAMVPGTADDEVAARTRPLDVKSFRKRKLFVPGVLLPKSAKKCFPVHNQPPCCRDSLSMPCVLCFSKRATVVSGVHQATPHRDLGGRESCKERAARLDPAVHPVLSGPQDVSRALHMAAHLRQPSWQQAQLRQRGLARLGLGLKRSKAAPSTGNVGSCTVDLLSPSSQPPPQRRKYTMHKRNNNTAASTTSALSSKIRRKAKNRKRHRGRPAADNTDTFDKYRRNRKFSRHSVEGLSGLGGTDGDSMTGERPGPIPSPGISIESRTPRRKREDSYDIDNIVIPYSMAALTRVEKLEYKEILTPKWRMVEVARPPPLTAKSNLNKNGVVKPNTSTPPSPDSEVEDITDEAVIARHEALEVEERRKFRCPPSTRGMRGRRADSRAESSGANTPDPMSPNTQPVGEVGDSPLASPRATPLPPSMLLEDSHGSKLQGGSKPSGAGSKQPTGLRRRTVSSQRASPEPSTPGPEIAPFESRTFPLPEEVLKYMVSGSDHRNVNSSTSARSYGSHKVTEDSIVARPHMDESVPPSPCGTDSTESALPEDDDMDPEWTLESEMVPSPQSASSSGTGPVRSYRRTL